MKIVIEIDFDMVDINNAPNNSYSIVDNIIHACLEFDLNKNTPMGKVPLTDSNGKVIGTIMNI